MGIYPKCDLCKIELEDYGALLFSPPDGEGMTLKNHICKGCYDKLKKEYEL